MKRDTTENKLKKGRQNPTMTFQPTPEVREFLRQFKGMTGAMSRVLNEAIRAHGKQAVQSAFARDQALLVSVLNSDKECTERKPDAAGGAMNHLERGWKPEAIQGEPSTPPPAPARRPKKGPRKGW